MFFSIIIPTANRNDFLKECLDVVYTNLSVGEEFCEIIVTDDSEWNEARLFVTQRYSGVKWVEGPKRGPAANRNNGAQHALGNWLVFLDDDVIPDITLLKNYQDAISENPDSLAFEGAIYPDDRSLLLKEMSECPINEKGGCFWSANICVKREVFISINGFDENFKIAAQEDQDIYIRLKKNTAVKFVGNAFVIHPVRLTTLKNKIKRISISLENWVYFSMKHGTISQMLKEGFRTQLLAMIKSFRDCRAKLALYHVLVILQILPSIFFNYRKVNQKLRNQKW